MSRTFKITVVASSLASIALGYSVAVAQDLGEAPDQQQNVRPRVGLEQADMRVDEVSPELEAHLFKWAAASSKIEKMQGQHDRHVYDHTFKLEKLSTGLFYYEAPDKGRIDIEGIKVAPGALSKKVDEATGEAYALKSDVEEKWISDGERIMQVLEAQKQATIWPIPPQSRGENIMDGPLPFLFGMPPDLAKKRYVLEMLNENFGKNGDQIMLKVMPRWQQDAANWSEARVILSKATYLPTAVELKDPAGTTITVYTFKNVEVNKKRGILLGFSDPFKFPTRGYQVNVVETQSADAAQPPANSKTAPTRPAPGASRGVPVPSVVGKPWNEATAELEQAGFVVPKPQQGDKTDNPDLVYHVQSQIPPPKTLAKRGDKVTVVFDKLTPQTSAKPTGTSQQ